MKLERTLEAPRQLTTEQVKNLRSHPLAKLFPAMQGEAFQDLVKDIRDHGVIEPIVMDDDDLIVDGRNRRTACEELGMGCPAVRFSSLGLSLLVEEYIWSVNVMRRQLTDDQRAALVLEWEDPIRNEASNRSRANLKKGACVPDLVKTPHRESGTTRSKLAEMAGVTENKIRDVQTIRAMSPEVLPKIQQGKLKVRDAKKKSVTIEASITPDAEDVRRVAEVVGVSPALVYLASAVREVDAKLFRRLNNRDMTITAAVRMAMDKFEQLEGLR